MKPLANLKKTLKRQKKDKKLAPSEQTQVHLVNVGCMKLCPKNGVVICRPDRAGDQLFIIRSEHEIETLST